MPLRAISYVVIAMLIFAVQDALFKQLGQHNEVMQLIMLRMTAVVAIISALWFVQRRTLPLRSSNRLPMMLTGLMAFTAFSIYYTALGQVPLADGATVFMTAPLFVTALSVPLLRERVGLHRWMAVCIGFAAVVVMLQPTSELFKPVTALPLLSALIYSLIPIITRSLGSEEPAFTITFYMVLSYWMFSVVAGLAIYFYPAAPSDTGLWAELAQPWPAISPSALGGVLITAILFCVSVLLIIGAYRQAHVSVVAPFEYTYLVWATLMGFLFFGDTPSTLTWAAGAVVAASGAYIAFREHRLSALNSELPAVH